MSIIIGNDISERIFTDECDNSIFALDGNDLVDSGAGNDVVFGGEGNDIVRANVGDDVLIGGAGNDILDGGDGDDNLFGGAGADVLEGGEGADTFGFDFSEFDGLVDYVTDFTSGEDTIFIQGAGANPSVDYDAATGIVFVNGTAFIQLDPGLNVDEGNDFFLA